MLSVMERRSWVVDLESRPLILRIRVVTKKLEHFASCGFLPFVKSFSLSLVTSCAVACSCVLWIGGISWAAVGLFGLSVLTGWLIAGVLGVLALIAVGVLSYEVRNAIDLPDDLDLETGARLGARPVFTGHAVRHEAMGWPTPVDSNPVMARTAEAPVPGCYGRMGGI
jgi:hypothetical protein